MATLDETLAELKGITKALADHAIGNARSPAHSAHGALARLAPPDDFVPAQTNAESYAAELVRHKGMLAQQRVGFVPPKPDAAKPVAQEPQRTTGLTVATAARTITRWCYHRIRSAPRYNARSQCSGGTITAPTSRR